MKFDERMWTSVREYYLDILKKIFHETLLKARAENGLTQAKMAEILAMDERSYVYLEHGKTCCGALTLSLFLIYCCNDAGGFLDELRKAYEKGFDSVA